MQRSCFHGLLLLFALAEIAQGQLTFTTNNDSTITITGYTGPAAPVVIPSSTNGLPVTGIAANAFNNSLMTSVTIPYSVTNIGTSGNSFWGINLTSILVDANNPDYSSLDGVLFDKSQETLNRFPPGRGGTYTIPNSVTNIGTNAFDFCINLHNITIPNTVSSIADDAFFRCEALTNLVVPDSVTSIGADVFDHCIGLTTFTIPNSVTNLGPFAFFQCSSLTNVTLSEALATIGDGTFEFCGLTTITIPNSVTTIAGYAFNECNNLTNLTLGNRVASVGDYAFSFASMSNVTFPSCLTNIGDYAFNECPNLTAVFFHGNAPSANPFVISGSVLGATAYYLPGTTGWGSTFARIPAVLWNPQAQTTVGSFGVRNNQFGFNVTGTSNIPVVVEASTDLTGSAWTALQSCTLTNGSIYFGDPAWTNYPARFYRLRSP